MSKQHTPGRTLDQIGRDLVAVKKLARLEKKELGGVSPRTTSRFWKLSAEFEALCSIDDARKPRAATGATPC